MAYTLLFIYSGTQTHITGDQIIFDNSRDYKSDLGESVDSLPQIHKQSRRMIQCDQELALTKNHLYSIQKNYEKLKLKFHKLYADYNKLNNVAGVLTIALENSVIGQAVDIEQTLEACKNIYPDIFNQDTRDISCVRLRHFITFFYYCSFYICFLIFRYFPQTSLLQRGNGNRLCNTDKVPPKLDITTVLVPSNLLDFKRIKSHLLNGDVKTKLLLLQALRWV